MEFSRSKKGIFVNQHKYVLDLLNETGLLGCKPVETPIEPNLKLQSSKTEKIQQKEQYQRLVGRLIYLSHTHPDIAFAVSMVSQFMHSLGQEHFNEFSDTYRELLEGVYCSKNVDTCKLKPILMLIGLGVLLIDDQLLVTVRLLEATLSPGRVKNRMWLQEAMQRLSLNQLLMEFVKCCGLRDY